MKRSLVIGLFSGTALVLAINSAARADYNQNFDTGSATYTVNDPYWLSNPQANGFITKTTNTPAIWPGNPGGFGTDINADVSGNGYFLFEGTDSYPAGGNIPAGLDEFFVSPTFPVTPNTSYLVQFYLANADTLGVNLAAVRPEIGGSFLGVGPVSAIGTWTSNGWLNFGFAWNSGANTSASLILHDVAPSSAGNDFGVDNISVTQLPEPTSASVLVLGAAGLLARRRRRIA